MGFVPLAKSEATGRCVGGRGTSFLAGAGGATPELGVGRGDRRHMFGANVFGANLSGANIVCILCFFLRFYL